MHKERKETTHVRGRWKKHTSTYIKKLSTMYVNENGHKT